MEAVLFIGVQASGKTTFYQRYLSRTHMHINLDMLKTRYREQIFLEACIKAKQSFVVDNTNPTISDRDRYIKQVFPAGFDLIGYYFESNIKKCIERNEKREGKEKIPKGGLTMTYRNLVLPSYSEGFQKLYYVQIAENGFVIEDWKEDE